MNKHIAYDLNLFHMDNCYATVYTDPLVQDWFISSRLPRNSEAFVSEFLGILEETVSYVSRLHCIVPLAF